MQNGPLIGSLNSQERGPHVGLADPANDHPLGPRSGKGVPVGPHGACLDCYDLSNALSSIAQVAGITVIKLRAALQNYDESRFESGSEDPQKLMPREVLEQFGLALDDIRFVGAYYFHGTRVLHPERFLSYGILPLDQMVEEIWAMLYELVRSDRTEKQWSEFRAIVEQGDSSAYGHDCEHFSGLYRLKTRADRRRLLGPYGLLVREVFVDPQATWSHDYLASPEIIRDIAICYRAIFGVDLERRFHDASKPCIIKFRTDHGELGAVITALWYVYRKLRGEKVTDIVGWSFDGEGVLVPPEAITAIEVVPRILRRNKI